MKKTVLFVAAALMSFATLFAQEDLLKKATETMNAGSSAFQMENYDNALTQYREALALAEQCGEKGADLIGKCKTNIANTLYMQARQLFNGKDYEAAVAKAREASALATECGNEEVQSGAENLIENATTRKAFGEAVAAMKAQDYAKAVEGFKALAEKDSTNGQYSLLLGQAYNAQGEADAAIAAQVAARNGKESVARKQISTTYLRIANNLKKDNPKEAIAACENALQYNEKNDQACYLAASCAQKLGKSADAISFYEKYVEIKGDSPKVKPVYFTLGALYQKSGNKAKALEYYRKAADDPQIGAKAKEQIAALSK